MVPLHLFGADNLPHWVSGGADSNQLATAALERSAAIRCLRQDGAKHVNAAMLLGRLLPA
jgi:hypothetical protein